MHSWILSAALALSSWPPGSNFQLDGRLDEEAWQAIVPSTEFHQIKPQASSSPPFQTTIRVAADAQYLYIGAVLDDPQAGPRQSNRSRRDHIPATDDSLIIMLDPVGTRVFAQVFQVNPDCSINDGLYKEASLSTDFSVDFSFAVACQKQEQGWTVEWQIPWRELRFTSDTDQPWHLLIQRSLVREQMLTLANAPLPADPLCLLCLAPDLPRPTGLPDPHFISLRPYALGRHTDKTRLETGLDVKYRINSGLIMDATIHPDFSQVDLDEPQLAANTLFAVSSPENRPFFLEGADILETPLKAVATRSITQPSWGLKLTHRAARNNTMILSGDDRSSNRLLIPGPYGSRFRSIQTRQKYLIASSHWKTAASNLAMMVTHRSYEQLGSNQTWGLDGLHYLGAEDSLRWQSLLSLSSNAWNQETNAVEKSRAQAGHAQYLVFQHKGELWHSSLEWKSFSQGFRSDLGFNPRRAYRLGIVTQSYHQNFGDQRLALYLKLSKKTELSARPMQDQLAPGVTWNGFLGTDVTFESRPWLWERIRESSGGHRYRQQSLSISAYPGPILPYLSCELVWGQRLDVSDDRVRPGRTESCSLRLAPWQTVELNASASQETLLEHRWHDSKAIVLRNRVLRQLLVLPLHQRLSLRYIRQEDKTMRSPNPTRSTQSESLNITYEEPESLSLYAGATSSWEPGSKPQTRRDYYLKVIADLP